MLDYKGVNATFCRVVIRMRYVTGSLPQFPENNIIVNETMIRHSKKSSDYYPKLSFRVCHERKRILSAEVLPYQSEKTVTLHKTFIMDTSEGVAPEDEIRLPSSVNPARMDLTGKESFHLFFI